MEWGFNSTSEEHTDLTQTHCTIQISTPPAAASSSNKVFAAFLDRGPYGAPHAVLGADQVVLFFRSTVGLRLGQNVSSA